MKIVLIKGPLRRLAWFIFTHSQIEKILRRSERGLKHVWET